MNKEISLFPHFLSFEIVAHPERTWTLAERFGDEESVFAWKASKQRRALLDELAAMGGKIEESTPEIQGVTEVFITKVLPEKEEAFRKWLAKVHLAEAKFPGFKGMYVQSPVQSQGEHWITFLQYDSEQSLDFWLNSKERREVVSELDPLISNLETHRVISAYAGWFGSMAKEGGIPPVWKQTLLVLLVLFPIVMLEFGYLNPYTQPLNISLATFIGNAISVTLISWPMMPIAIFFFRWWLTPYSTLKVNLGGVLALALIYLIEIVGFWSFV